MYKLKTYTSKLPPGNFYIQNKGLHSGRPLKFPIRNCYVVYTDDDLLFEKVYSLFIGRMFEPIIHGTAIPTIRIGDVREVIEISLARHKGISKELQIIRNIDQMLQKLEKQRAVYKELQVAVCRKINS